MKTPVKILFVSSFLSGSSGSLCASESIGLRLNDLGFSTAFVSRKKNKIKRLIEIILSILFTKSDIIHIDVYSGQAFIISEIASKIAFFLNKKIVLTLHGGALPVFYKGNEERIRRVFNRAKLITTPSNMLSNFFKSVGFDTLVIPNSIDLERFPFKRNLENPYSLLWVRAFDSIYNPEMAIETLYSVQKKFPNANLTMVGPDKGKLKDCIELIQRLGLNDSVKIVGPIENHKLPEYYQNHHVYLNTTRFESFGVALLEAASSGIPIVSTNVGEVPLIWKNETEILLVEIDNSEMMSHQVCRLFENENFANDIADRAMIKSKLYGWDAVSTIWVEKIKSVYESKN